jgi:putative flippase GtrA
MKLAEGLARLGVRQGEPGAVLRFALVGVAATLSYLGVSLLLLDRGWVPQLANLGGFAAGTGLSYLGHYFFTYRSNERHLKTGSRFIGTTIGLTLASSLLHQAVLLLGAEPRLASLVVTCCYPPLSFLLNHFWSFSRGGRKSGA